MCNTVTHDRIRRACPGSGLSLVSRYTCLCIGHLTWGTAHVLQDLQRRYHGRTSNSPPAGPAAAKATSADLAVVADYLSQRGWANILVNNGQDDDLASQEVDEQLNEVWMRKGIRWNLCDSSHQRAIFVICARGVTIPVHSC